MQSAPAIIRMLGRAVRNAGVALDAIGLSMSPHLTKETLVPSTRVVSFKDKELVSGRRTFVASSASVVGDVVLGESSSVWYGAVVRGDKAPVRVGSNVAVLDNALVLSSQVGKGVELGNDVVIAPGAVVRSAKIGEGAMIGMGAQVLPGTSVGADSFVDAGAIVTAGTVIPAGQLWTGNPARHLRNLSPAEMSYLRSTALAYSALGIEHRAENAKSAEDVEEDLDLRWAKLEGGYAPNISVSEVDEDVQRYYKLTEKHANPGLFRDEETVVEKDMAAIAAEELAADRAEEAYHGAVARNKRVAEAVAALADTRPDRPEEKGRILEALGKRDAEGLGMVLGLVGRAVDVSSPSAPTLERDDVLRTLKTLTQGTDAQASSLLSALAAHGKQ